jgi:hypothetical protein
MKVGDLVKVVAPEAFTGCAAGKIGLITSLCDAGGGVMLKHPDCVVMIFEEDIGAKDVYLRRNEIEVLSEA